MDHQNPTKKIGKYMIQGVLGHGGMGSVYKALDPDNENIIALKLLNFSGPLAKILDKKTLQNAFTQEAITMSRLHHPNIVEILDFDFAHDTPFYTMEYFCNNLAMVTGENFLRDEISRLLSPEVAVDYGCQILAGLECLHDAGVIHRDIKPSNMMLTENDTIKICDFGLARFEENEPFYSKGINIGSPYYSAPEQISTPERADARSDLYSAGVLIYRMLTGEMPGMKDFLLSHVDHLYDHAWDDFFAQALSWKPELRFQSSQEMAGELQQLQLNWKKRKKKKCRSFKKKADKGPSTTLRSEAVRVSGVKAKKLFGLDNLWQPNSYISNVFRITDNNQVLDEATGLIWRLVPSDSPLDRQSADNLIEMLNETRFNKVQSWRLPTINELVSLIDDPAIPQNNCPEKPLFSSNEWLWSCDRRSQTTSWYLNMKVGYVGWQDDNCHYTVYAVASLKN